MIRMAAENAHAEGKWIGICGELGADLELTEEFRQGKQQSEKLMESEKKRLTELTERLEKGDERGKRILKYINPEFLTKEIVEELIDHIVVGKKSKETGEIPVEIHWNF